MGKEIKMHTIKYMIGVMQAYTNGKHIEFREIELDNDLLKETQND